MDHHHAFRFLFAHDPFGKPLHTFPDHASAQPPSWRINAAQRSSSGRILSALAESRLTTTRETPLSRSRLSRSRFSLAPQIVIGTEAGSRPASAAISRNFGRKVCTSAYWVRER